LARVNLPANFEQTANSKQRARRHTLGRLDGCQQSNNMTLNEDSCHFSRHVAYANSVSSSRGASFAFNYLQTRRPSSEPGEQVSGRCAKNSPAIQRGSAFTLINPRYMHSLVFRLSNSILGPVCGWLLACGFMGYFRAPCLPSYWFADLAVF